MSQIGDQEMLNCLKATRVWFGAIEGALASIKLGPVSFIQCKTCKKSLVFYRCSKC